jgi:hypothetical protein
MSTYPIAHCQHIKKNGSQCGSPALRNQEFCYFHDRCRPLIQDGSGFAQIPSAPFFLPRLDDANSIQQALAKVCQNLLHRRLDPKKAGVLFYAMQVASSNLHRPNNKLRVRRKAPRHRLPPEACVVAKLVWWWGSAPPARGGAPSPHVRFAPQLQTAPP